MDPRALGFLGSNKIAQLVLSQALTVLTALAWTPAAALDTVDVAASGGGAGRARLVGTVVEYTGEQLVLELPGGRRQEVPGDKVLRVQTEYGPEHAEADRRLETARFAEALALYRKAIDAEPRRWVRRLVLSRMVWCYQGLDEPGPACETFLLLVQSDPATPYFDCVPLAWAPGQPTPAVEQAAARWMAQDVRQAPAAVLLGASHLLSTAKRPTALQRLKGLSTSADRRIAQLAYAQTWRAAVNVDEEQLASWQRTIEAMPEPLRAGPYYALGRAFGQRQQWDDAALAWLRLPILYPQHRVLAARSLLEAAQALDRLGQTDRAVALYRELARSYPETRSAAEGSGRLEEIEKEPGKG